MIDETAFKENTTCDKKPDTLRNGGASVRQPCYQSCHGILNGIKADDAIPTNKANAYNACVAKCDKLEATARESCISNLSAQRSRSSQIRQTRTVLVIGLPILILLIAILVFIIYKIKH
jgi:hypothetical protein